MGLFGKNWKGRDLPEYIGGEEHSSKKARERDQNRWEQQFQNTAEEKRRVFGFETGTGSSDPTATAATGRRGEVEYEPPPGPPPGRGIDGEEYAPLPGPPPSHGKANEKYGPPPGPPPNPSSDDAVNPPPYHDWTAIPDTALLPPPPTVRHERSVNNSSEEDATRAHEWCARNALFTPAKPHAALQDAVRNGEVKLIAPREFYGELTRDKFKTWKGRARGTRDAILVTAVPLYFAAVDSPLQTGLTKTIYYEVKLVHVGRMGRHTDDSGLAMGFCAQPYPSWRLPGHERASLGVHGDDGRRFVNDSYGGLDFTEPFRADETLGIGMKFTSAGQDAGVAVFFTRNGERKGGWNLDEERDESAGDIAGLEGGRDLYGAIGVFGDVKFEVSFARETWLYHPR